MKKLLLTLSLVVLAVIGAMAQRTISGKVTDKQSQPLIGASVLVKGSTTGTVTEVDGSYSLTVPANNTGSILLISYTGYLSQEIALGASNVVDAQLEENAQQLNEVLVTSIGIKRDKKALGYSVTNLSGSDLQQRSEVDPVRAVAGKVPGVQITGGGGAPGQSTKINIRGFSSLTGNTQPLFVVDGVPFDNSVNATTGASGGTQYSSRGFDLDPNNIESMTILKGAAASALYGSRATNGVVLVTTKSGSKNARKGLEVTYSASYQNEKISGIPEYQNVYGQGSAQNYNGGFIGNWGAPFANQVDRINAQYGYARYSKIIEPGYGEGIIRHPLVSTGYAAPRYSNVFPELFETDPNNPSAKRPIGVPYRSYDIIDKFFRTGNLVENSLNISAGGKEGSLNAIVSRMSNDGIVPNSKSGRTTFSFGGNSKLANGLTLSGNVNYVNTTQSNPPIGASIFGGNNGTSEGSIFTRLFFLPRNYDLMEQNPEGIPYPFENPVSGDNVFYRALDNPRWLVKYNSYSSTVNRVYGNMALTYDVLPWLNLTARGGVNTYSEARKNIVRAGGVGDPNGAVWTDNIVNTEIDMNYLATITKNITPDLDFRLITGFNWNQRSFNDNFVAGDGIISTGLYNTNATQTQLSTETNRKQRFYAGYADLQLGYKDFLYLGATARNDFSSTLPKENNSYFYPGVNSSFIITDAFGIKSNIFSFGKIRAALTQVGNEATPYRTTTPYNLRTPFTSATGSLFNLATLSNTLGNNTLVNELTTELEFGADFRFLRNRIGLDVTWFKRNSTNQITQTTVAGTSGFTRAIVNAGEIQNKGLEVALNITPIKTASGFEWTTTFNFTRIRSLVVNAGEGGDIFVGGYSSTLGTIHRTGQPFGQIFGSQIARTPEGDLLIDKTTGQTIQNARAQIIGNPNPDFNLSFINNFSWKGFTLNALFDWRQGGDMYLTTAGSLLLRGQLKLTEDREAVRVIPGVYGNPQTFQALKNEQGNYIRNTTGMTAFDYHFSNGFGIYGADETNVYDITTIRLREVTLGYQFPKKLLAKTPIGSARISISGRNLWWRTPNILKGVNQDPEVLAETSVSNVQGFEYGGYPTTRRYGVNLSVTF